MKNLILPLTFAALLFSIYAGGADHKFENVLYIGDSHSYGNFGKTLDSYLRSIGTNVTSIASCGSSPSNWMSTNNGYKKTVCGYWRKEPSGNETRVKSHDINALPEELKKTHADLTVIALGTNILSSPADIAREKITIEKMLSKIDESHSKCVWVGPPDAGRDPFKKNLALGVKEIREVVEKHHCLFVDSSQLTHYPPGTSDGIHYGGKDATAWGEKVSAEIGKNLTKIEKQSPVASDKKGPQAGGVR